FAADFAQSGAIAALNDGEDAIAELRGELKAARDLVLSGLRALPGVEAVEPEGGMYAFFRVQGRGQSMALAKDLVAKAALGVAPGSAFGPEGEGWLRWCFAHRPEKNLGGLERLAACLQA